MLRFGDFIFRILSPWMRDGWGQRFVMGGIRTQADATAEAMQCALRAPWLADSYSPVDALIPAGHERRMPRYSIETDDQYRARLLLAWDAYRYAGSEQSILGQLAAFGFSVVQPTIEPLDRWRTIAGALATGGADPDGGTAAVTFTPTATITWHAVLSSVDAIDAAPGQTVRASFLYYNPVAAVPRLDVRVVTASIVNRLTATVDVWSPYGVLASSGFDFVVVEDAGSGWVRITVEWAYQDGDRLYAAPHAVGANWGNTLGYVFSFYDLTIESARVDVVSAIEAGDPIATAWWSLFWVVVPIEAHSYVGAIPAEDQAAIIALIKQWKPAHWMCGSVTFITSGHLWDYHEPLVTWDDFTGASITWGDATVLTVTDGSGF